VHGRTRACRFRGAAEYETIAAIKSSVGIPVIANGDINTLKKSLEVLHASGADALMIGRAAQGRPWFFQELDYYLKFGVAISPLENNKVRDIMLDHLGDLYQFYGETTGVRVARKHLTWYCAGLKNSDTYRSRVVRVESASEQLRLTREFFQRQADIALLAA
jgi:tRNA-dihydrouridine synthase B